MSHSETNEGIETGVFERENVIESSDVISWPPTVLEEVPNVDAEPTDPEKAATKYFGARIELHDHSGSLDPTPPVSLGADVLERIERLRAETDSILKDLPPTSDDPFHSAAQARDQLESVYQRLAGMRNSLYFGGAPQAPLAPTEGEDQAEDAAIATPDVATLQAHLSSSSTASSTDASSSSSSSSPSPTQPPLTHLLPSASASASASVTMGTGASPQDSVRLVRMEQRLASMERSLGLAQDAPSDIPSILRSIDRRLGMLHPVSLDELGARLTTLTRQMVQFDKARQSASAHSHMRPGATPHGASVLRSPSAMNSPARPPPSPATSPIPGRSIMPSPARFDPRPPPPELLVAERTKIAQIHDMLSTCQEQAARVPALVERLASLRTVHDEAGSFRDTLRGLRTEQERLAAMLEQDTRALGSLERGLAENTERIQSNTAGLASRADRLAELLQAQRAAGVSGTPKRP